ncbi:MAG TPA: hypothetical protein VFA27_08475 [Vicinamibacterales bacterium]|nr:hypothetical protein [Vicinamibacterales bacterium]
MTAERPPRALWADGIVGVAAFLAAHGIERLLWRAQFDPAGGTTPWFLNSGRAVAFMAVWMLAVGAVLGSRPTRADWTRNALAATIGAIAAMVGVLAVVGPGTIFPLVIAIGSAVLAASLFAGWLLRRLIDS